MESAFLTKAHDHARAAAIATQTSDTTVAISEHAQAAGEFANASKTTSSIEALRTLKLLEQHHRRLSELLKLPIGPPSQTRTDSDIAEEVEEKSQAPAQAQEPDASKAAKQHREPPASKEPTSTKPLPTLSQNRYPGRNLSSSIASNLASARGIRARYTTQPLTPSVSNDQAPGSVEVRPRRDGPTKSKAPSWVPPVIQEDAADEPPKPEESRPPESEDGFARFYSTFGSLINRLSAPLAFAGLPLLADEPAPAPAATPAPAPPPLAEPTQRRSRHRQSASATEPDLSKIYSRATLRSLERDGNDSFYVVPTSGHTASYASILNHENKEKRRMAASLHRSDHDHGSGRSRGHRGGGEDGNEDEDDFVDARESQALAPHSPTLRKRLGARGRSEKELYNVIEELHLENASLKDMLDKVSKRLHAFELNSQSSHLALAQSLRLQRPGSPPSHPHLPAASSASSSGGGGAGTSGEREDGESALQLLQLQRRNRELEERMSEMVKRMESVEKDNMKLQLTVQKYRERWEQLKAGAKARRAQEKGNG